MVHFGYSRADYDALTETEKAFISKAYEEKTVAETTLLRDAVYNAVGNALRKKGKPFRKLWKKIIHTTRADAKETQDIIKEIEAKEKKHGGKSWIEKIYESAGKRPPKKK